MQQLFSSMYTINDDDGDNNLYMLERVLDCFHWCNVHGVWWKTHLNVASSIHNLFDLTRHPLERLCHRLSLNCSTSSGFGYDLAVSLWKPTDVHLN